MNTKYYYGLGRRKRSSVRAKYYDAETLEVTANGRDAKEYFTAYYYETLQTMFTNIGLKTGKITLFSNGGGLTGQSEAARLAIAKALLQKDETIKPTLKQFNYLTTDNRKVLPKRSGLRKARKARQWVKR
jgi:small subunit ribosomal protein S9